MQQTILFSKIWAGMLGGAIGDAMGGPVEGKDYREIEKEYGVLDTFLPYSFPPDYHNHFSNAPGSYTDDTRLKHLLCNAIINAEGLPLPGDFARVLTEAYYGARNELERGFLEEYVFGGHYGEDKLIFGGQPTNGAIMMNSPIGLICPADPDTAFETAHRLAYITDGYAKYSAAIMAASVAAAMSPETTVEAVVSSALAAAKKHSRVGPLTRDWQWYDHVFDLNQRLVETAVEIALKQSDVFAIRPLFYDKLKVNHLGSEAAQTLAVALGMFTAAKGDLRQTIVGAVNYGRDNDSYASIAGALAGAYNGIKAVPDAWIEIVVSANPEPDMLELTSGLCNVAIKRIRKHQTIVKQVKNLFEFEEEND